MPRKELLVLLYAGECSITGLSAQFCRFSIQGMSRKPQGLYFIKKNPISTFFLYINLEQTDKFACKRYPAQAPRLLPVRNLKTTNR